MFFFNKKKGSIQNISVIILAAGNSTRFSDNFNKLFYNIYGYPLIYWSLKSFNDIEYIDEIIVVTRNENIKDIKEIKDYFGIDKISKIVRGGNTRQESCFHGLSCISDDVDYVLIHDAARCCIHSSDINSLIEYGIKNNDNCILAKKSVDTLKFVDDNMKIKNTLDRNYVYCSETPQMFLFNEYKNIINDSLTKNLNFTDDSQMFEHYKLSVSIVESNYKNFKVTFYEDVFICESIIKNRFETIV